MEGMPKIHVITVTFDADTDEIDLNYDDEVNAYEVLGLLYHALEIQKENCVGAEDD